jgi:hypothetical protein
MESLIHMNVDEIVTYDQSTRNWIYQPSNGPAVAFPRGIAGKTEAYMMRLKHETPKVAKMLQYLETTNEVKPETMRRAFDGAVILANNFILKPGTNDDPAVKARAATTSSPNEYLICPEEIPNSLYLCTCPDWIRGYEHTDGFLANPPNLPKKDKKPGAPKLPIIGHMCKHTWAYHLGSIINYPLADLNPNETMMAEKLWKEAQEILGEFPDLLEIFKDCQPMSMSRGEFSLAIPDPILKKIKKQPSLRTYLEQAVQHATNGSQSLVVF